MAQQATVRLLGSAALVFLVTALGSAARGGGFTVGAATVTVQGASRQVLTDAQDMTLYYSSADTFGHSMCTGGCARTWPPLLSDVAPTSSRPLPGKLTIAKTSNGPQVSYNGHPLHRYSGDTAPGQANGQGVAGRWRVAGLDLEPLAASSTVQNGESGTGREGTGGGTGGGGMGGGMGGH